MKKDKVKEKNYLDFIPIKNSDYEWDVDEEQVVTIQVPNKGVFAKVAQVAFNRPKISYISLDAYGNFIWPLIDGEKTIYEIAQAVKKHYGDAAEPLYERIVRYFQTLQGHGFVKMSE